MTTEIINQVKEALIPLANKIGEGAGYSWEVIIRQQIIEGVLYLASAVLLGIVLYIIYKVAKSRYKKEMKNYFSDADWIIFAASLIAVIPSITFMVALTNGILHLLNPAFYAIQFLIG